MPYDFDKQKRAYFDGTEYVSRVALRELIDKLLDHTKREATRIAQRFDAGDITAAEFELLMRELLRDAHVVSGTVGRGGRERMSFSDWGKIGNKIRSQYEYLAKFRAKLERGALSKAATVSRARSYIGAVYTSFADGVATAYEEAKASGFVPKGDMVRLVQNSKEGCEECNNDAAEGWIPEADMSPLFTRICGDYCLCELEWKSDVE